ncbi:MAG TPA: glycosyltransferase family 2 protein [Mycobacteriales bacterium]|nr:glycosyltransferase family 2 protein [Mycobacteriales bacterium]
MAPTGAPLVTVVVIAYNDAARLPRAVASALRQRLREIEVVVVDDASTDSTGSVADALATRDSRVRVLHLPTNSGGCSRPRNAGVEQARGEFVMFLDSDDELTPNACQDLWRAASQEDADFSAGLTVRVYDGPHGWRGYWKPELYARREVVDGLAARPELMADTLSTNKCWRRSFLLEHGLAFPEGMHFEDLVFTAQAYAAARRFVLVPQPVYLWHVASGEGEASITNRRSELANLRDRLEANRRIDGVLTEHGLQDLKLTKDVKFVRHDLRLYAQDLLTAEPERAHAVMAELGDYLRTLEPGAARQAGPMHAVEVFAITQGDLAGARSAARYLGHGRKVSELLVQDGDRVLWGGRHQGSPGARDALDVTELGLHARPTFFHEVTELRREGAVLHVSGRTLNQLGKLAAASLQLRARPRWRVGTTRQIAITRTGTDDHWLQWSVALDLASALRPWGLVDELYELEVVAGVDGSERADPLTADVLQDELDVPARPRLSRLTGTHWRPVVSPHGNLQLRLVALSASSQRLRRLVPVGRAEALARRSRRRLLAARQRARLRASARRGPA